MCLIQYVLLDCVHTSNGHPVLRWEHVACWQAHPVGEADSSAMNAELVMQPDAKVVVLQTGGNLHRHVISRTGCVCLIDAPTPTAECTHTYHRQVTRLS